MISVNFMIGEAALPISLVKGLTNKHNINNAGRMCDDTTDDDKCILHGPQQTLNRSVEHFTLDNLFICKT